MNPKCKILIKTPAEGYSTDHVISVNTQFTHQQRRIRIPYVTSKAPIVERKISEEAVSEDRKHAIEASVVRVMKSRKSLAHQQLISEVSQLLMKFFPPDPKQIKKRIEVLCLLCVTV